jgi:hypothetical protein
MKTFDFSVLEYLGKVEGGILVLLSVVHESKYYESTFFYNESEMILTISDQLEQIVGDFKTHPEYFNSLRDILKKVVPFNEMYDRIDVVDFSRWVEGYIELEMGEAERIPASHINRESNPQ